MLGILNNHKTMIKNVYYFYHWRIDTGIEGSGDEDGSDPSGNPVVSMDVFRECSDRVMMPCDSEEFITVGLIHYNCNI
jgi:hypothetical protein